jgi:hypothetical protein
MYQRSRKKSSSEKEENQPYVALYSSISAPVGVHSQNFFDFLSPFLTKFGQLKKGCVEHRHIAYSGGKSIIWSTFYPSEVRPG